MLDLSRYACLGEALRDPTITYKSNIALIEADRHRENGRWTYLELRREAERVAALLQQVGVEAGDRCAILMSNQSKWVMSGLGALWAGSVLVPLDYKLTAAEQAALLAHAKPKVLITEYSIYRALLRTAVQALESLTVFVTEAPQGEDIGRALRWEMDAEKEFCYVGRQRQDVACIVYSSGTGGRPKGCVLIHDNYLEQAQSLGRLFVDGKFGPMVESDRFFSVLPTNHAVDFMCGMIMALLFGAAVVHQRTLRPEFFAPTMKRYGVTHIALVPRLLRTFEQRIREQIDGLSSYQRLIIDGLITANELATERQRNHALSSLLLRPIHQKFGGHLRLIVAGSAYVDPDCVDYLYRLGFPVAIGYGLTETCTVSTLNDLRPFRSNTVGKPVDGVEIEIRDKNEAGVGEIFIKGRTVMKEYLNDPELTQETFVNGWLRTGDLGRFDASGHLTIVGRCKNMIVTEGAKNVYPEDIETSYEKLNECEELCVFAANFIWRSGKITEDALVVVIRPKRGQSTEKLVEEIKTRNRKLADYKRPSSYLIWNQEFPRTASMKVKREQLAVEIASKLQRTEALQPL